MLWFKWTYFKFTFLSSFLNLMPRDSTIVFIYLKYISESDSCFSIWATFISFFRKSRNIWYVYSLNLPVFTVIQRNFATWITMLSLALPWENIFLSLSFIISIKRPSHLSNNLPRISSYFYPNQSLAVCTWNNISIRLVSKYDTFLSMTSM